MRDQCARLTDLGHPAVMLASGEDNQQALDGHPQRRRDGRLRRARALRLDRLPQRDRAAHDRAVRRRRGALRVRVGPRLPPRLPAAGVDHRRARPPADDGLHRDRDAEGRGGDRRAARSQGARARAVRLRPPEPQLRRPPVRRRGQRRAQAGDARRRPQGPREPAGGRLLRHAQVDRGDRGDAAAPRAQHRRLPRGLRRRRAHPRAGRVHARRGRRRRRHQRLRDGRRQGRRALGLALGAAERASRPTTRRPAARAATERPRARSCSPRARTSGASCASSARPR